MFKDHRRGFVTAVVGALALWAGACGGSGDANDTPSAAKDAAPLRLIDINATPRDQLKDGGTMRWPLDQFSTQWNYGELDGTTSATYDVVLGLEGFPFIADEHANVTTNPDYLTSATASTASGKQVVTLKINPQAKWSNGRAMSWQDYQTQWQALRSADNGYAISGSTGYERISKIERGAAPTDVVMTFARPFGEWRSLFTPLYPKEGQDTPAHFNKGFLNKIPITAGPFKVEKFDLTAKTLRVVRDPKWWGRPAKLDAIVYSSPELDAQVNAFANGEVDRVNIGGDPSAFKRARDTPSGVVRIAGGPDFRHFTINGTGPILSDVNVRRAVALAINREAIAKSDLTGLDWPVRTMNNHFFVNTQVGYADESGEYGKFDPAKAKTMLDAAGWKLSGAYRTKGGKPLELRFVIPSGYTASRQEGELTQAMLKDVGIKLDVRTIPSDDFFTKYVNIGNFDIAPFSWLGTPFPISAGKSIYVNPTKDRKGELVIQQNYARVGSPQIDKLLTEAEEQGDIVRARKLLNEADKLVWDEVHSLTMFQRPQNIAVNKKLANVGAFGFKTPAFADIGFVK